MKKSSNKVNARNKKVASLRGDSWKKNLKKGWLDSQMHPTKLKLARVSRGLSQTDAAKVANLSLSTYGGIERGKRPVSKKTIDLLAKSLKVTPEVLFKQMLNAKGKFKAI